VPWRCGEGAFLFQSAGVAKRNGVDPGACGLGYCAACPIPEARVESSLTMTKKSVPKKKKELKKAEIELSSDESRELGMIMDRLAVQSPEGESLDNYLRSLRNTLKGREALTVALIEALGRNPSEVRFRAFVILRDILEGGKGARVLKQTAYRFAQRGYALPSEKPNRDVSLVASETRQSIAYMVMEAEPCFLVSALVHSGGSSEPMALVAFFKEGFDQLRFEVAPSSNKSFKEFVSRTSRSLPSPMCEIPIWHAAGLILEMMEWSRGSRPASSGTVKRILEPFHEPGRKSYAHEVMKEIADPDGSLRDMDVAAVFDLLPVRWLLFSEQELKPWREAIVTAGSSVLVVSEALKYERTEGLVRKAAEALCVAAKRSFTQRFLEEGALWLHLTHRGQAASSAWAAAHHLARGGTPGENPVVVQLIAESLRRYWPDDFSTGSGTTEDPQAAAGLYDTTESGLIIPR
jgi:hypothetical protein